MLRKGFSTCSINWFGIGMEMGVNIFEKLQTEGPLQLAAKEEIEEIRQLKQQTISKTTFVAKYSGIYGRVYGRRHSND